MTLDVEKARRETPGCRHVMHFNNAGASLMPKAVLDAVTGHLELEGKIGGYEAARMAHEEIEEVYRAAARLLNCEDDEIAFMDSATRAWDTAFGALALKKPFAPGERILVSQAEYASNQIAMVQIAVRTGARIEPIPDDICGQVDVDALDRMIDGAVRLIAVTHVPTNGGLVNPAEEIGKIAKKHGIPYFLDACQSAGQIPLDVKEIDCDVLSLTGRKYLRAPRGTGILYVRQAFLECLDPPFPDLSSARLTGATSIKMAQGARRFESWETSIASKIGLGRAIDYALSWGLDKIERRVASLAADLRGRLGRENGVTVYDQGQRLCGIVTFAIAGEDPRETMQRLAANSINVHVSTPSSTWFDSASRHLPLLLRASVHYFNTGEELDKFMEVL